MMKLFLLALFLSSCATVTKVETPVVCIGKKPAKKYVATLTVRQHIPTGLQIEKAALSQDFLNSFANQLAEEFFVRFVEQGEVSLPVRFPTNDMGGFRLDIVRTGQMDFVICRDQCSGLVEFKGESDKSLKQFFDSNYFPELSMDEAFSSASRISKSVQKNDVKIMVSFNPKRFCENAKPKSELFTN